MFREGSNIELILVITSEICLLSAKNSLIRLIYYLVMEKVSLSQMILSWQLKMIRFK